MGVGRGCIREGCLEEVPFGMKLPVGSVSGPSIPSAFRQCKGNIWRWEMDWHLFPP